MPTPRGADDPVVLELDDFRFPAVAEPPDGVIVERDVWVRPGANGLYDASGQPIVDSFLRRGFDLGHYPRFGLGVGNLRRNRSAVAA
jgi:hypothetical protein